MIPLPVIALSVVLGLVSQEFAFDYRMEYTVTDYSFNKTYVKHYYINSRQNSYHASMVPKGDHAFRFEFQKANDVIAMADLTGDPTSAWDIVLNDTNFPPGIIVEKHLYGYDGELSASEKLNQHQAIRSRLIIKSSSIR